MSTLTTIEALIEEWPSETLLFVRAVPGFQINAPNPDAALIQARESLPVFLEWLRRLELEPPVDAGAALHVAERLVASGSQGPRFAADLIAVSEDELELALAAGRALISELIDAYDAARRDGSVPALEPVLRHVAEFDRWYASRIGLTEIGVPPAGVTDDLIAAASTFEEAADRAMETGDPTLILVDGEEWTLAKALRRRTGHLREHLIALPDPSDA